MIVGQQGVLAQSKKDSIASSRELKGKNPEQLLGEAAESLHKVARDQLKLKGDAKPTGGTARGVARQSRAGAKTVINYNKIMNVDKSYWQRIEAVQRAVQRKSVAERRIQRARENLDSAYLALFLTLPGMPASAAAAVLATLQRIDANSRRLGLGAALREAPRRGNSNDDGSPGRDGDTMGDRTGRGTGSGGTGNAGTGRGSGSSGNASSSNDGAGDVSTSKGGGDFVSDGGFDGPEHFGPKR